VRKEKNVNPVVVAIVVLAVIGLAVFAWMRYSTPAKPHQATLIDPHKITTLQPGDIKAGEKVVKENLAKPSRPADSR